MKTVAAELAYFLRGRARQNLKALVYYCLFLASLMLVYATLFRFLMWHLEGREYSLIAGIYWTITVMTTLGFGDITFHSDAGFVFAALVTISGVVFLLIILPFGLISLFLAPWIEYRLRNRFNQGLPNKASGHVVIFGYNPIVGAFAAKLAQQQIPFVIVVADHEQAQRLEDVSLPVVCGRATDAFVFESIRLTTARQVIACLGDPENATLCLLIRQQAQVPIAAFVEDSGHSSLLRQAGANQVIALHKILGRYLAIRSTTCGALAHILDTFGELRIAEIPVHGTPYAGIRLAEAKIGEQTGLAVIGIWERGSFAIATRDTLLNEDALLVLAGTREQLEALQQLTGEQASDDLVFILGHGRIGCAAARFLERRPVPFLLIDRSENPSCHEHVPIYGDATLRHVLDQVEIDRARGGIVTTNDDDTNIFLTLAIRQRLPHVRLVARANCDESVEALYQAGADFVVSNASVGANILLNILQGKATAFVTEGISVFRRSTPRGLVGQTIADCRLRQRTGCSIVAIESEESGDVLVSPSPETPLAADSTLLLIGTAEQERLFDTAIAQD
ncbi:MAG: NAD-binding protein [Desulfuromonadales bacterium]|nr:NAD-binding protein [Desulfuromonadales bacterium]